MDFLPIFLNLNQRRVLVVGGGDVAARKAGLLLRAQAAVRVVAPELCANLVALRDSGAVEHLAVAYRPNQLSDCVLVFAATNDDVVNAQVSVDARQRDIPVNVADRPELCSFILPSIVDRSPITVAVSTGGASPTLGRLLRARLETCIPAAYGRLADLMGHYRDAVKKRFPTFSQRRRFWEDMVQGPVAELMLAGREEAARQALEQAIQAADDDALRQGEVYLVGAGPGDPDLLTFRALRLMQQADVVLHDRLVSPQILDLVRREAERIYVGKRRSYHAVRQDEINRLLIDLAKQGKRVLRLKGGDPFIFGRGGEEIAGLAGERIAFQVVPGVTAANGCASYAGIPLTHRDHAQSVVFVTGQLKDGTVDLNWPALIQPNQTLVVYMGLAALAIICGELIAHGMRGETPIALVEQGTLPKQQVYTGTLQSLPGQLEGAQIHAPTLLIVGDVVKLHRQLAWFQ